MSNKLRIGIVGCGWFGNFHLDYLLTRNDVEVTALASTNAEKLKNTAARVPQARCYQTPEALIEAGDADALLLCLPPHCHGNIEMLSAAKGLHLYVEKPLGTDLSAAQSAWKAIQQAGIVCSVGYQARYETGIAEMRDHLLSSPAAFIQARWVGDEPGVHWWRDRSKSGGQVVEQSTHLVDLMRYLAGEATAVFATAQTALPAPLEGSTVDGGTTALVWFKSGAIASLTTGCFNDPAKAKNEIGLLAYCRDGQVNFDWSDGVQFNAKQDARQFQACGCIHANALAAFVDAAKSGDASGVLSTYGDALETFKLTLAIEESLRTGRKVSL